jgi:nucleotide-binding universal stress UspA family protein
MFKHILVSTDGSPLSLKGIKAGVRLAAALGAKVTGVCVIPPWRTPVYGEGITYGVPRSPAQYKEAMEKAARKALAAVEIEAEMRGVPCATQFVTAERAWEGILRVAKARRCDLLSIASHGRGGLSGLLIGSETQRVLAHSKLPVLVTR